MSAVVAGVGLRVDSDSNALLYGGGVAPAAILRGEVAQPANLMAPLLQVCPERSAPHLGTIWKAAGKRERSVLCDHDSVVRGFIFGQPGCCVRTCCQ